MNSYLIEITGYDTANSVEQILYFSSVSFPPFAGSDLHRPHQYYEPRVLDIGGIARRMFSTGTTYGRNSPNGGAITIDNSGGVYDHLLDWGFDGRRVQIFYGDVDDSWSQFTKILDGTLTQPFFSLGKDSAASIEFVARDKNQTLESNIQTNLYLGTNSGSTGDEGLADDLKGTVKPLCFGHCFNVTPRQSNSAGLRYQVHDGQISDVPACYDNGVSLTKVGGTPSAGQYSVDTANGIITLGGSPAGLVTCDVQGHAPSGVYKTTVADICESVLLNYGGITGSEINSTALTALNTANSSVVGIYLSRATTMTRVLDELCAAIGGYWFFDRLGVYQTGRFEEPSTTSKTYTDIELIEFDSFRSSDVDKGVPVNKFVLNYKKIYTVQNADALAGSVSVERSGFLATEYRSSASEDASVLAVHLLSPEVERESLITVEADANTESIRLLNLYKEKRSFYRIVVPQGDFLELGESIEIVSNRFGLQNGKDYVIISIVDQSPEDNMTELEVWG